MGFGGCFLEPGGLLILGEDSYWPVSRDLGASLRLSGLCCEAAARCEDRWMPWERSGDLGMASRLRDAMAPVRCFIGIGTGWSFSPFQFLYIFCPPRRDGSSVWSCGLDSVHRYSF